MVDVYILGDTLIYGSVLALLSLGITLIYMTTKVFNFAHPRLSLVGAYLSATVMVEYINRKGITPNFEWHGESFMYRLPWPAEVYVIGLLAAVLGGIIAALVEYYAILKPLLNRGADYLKLMIATLAYDFILMGVLLIYNTQRNIVQIMDKAGILSTKMDFSSYDGAIRTATTIMPFDLWYSLISVAVLTIVIFILLFKTTLGVKMRASIENPPLAEVLGINVQRIYAISWIISGATAGLAGFLIMFKPNAGGLKPISATSPADEIVVSAFAGSIVGGVNSIFGSIGGGLIIGIIEVYVTHFLADITGIGALIKYSKVISMLAVALTLLFAPQGLAGLVKKYYQRMRGPEALPGEVSPSSTSESSGDSSGGGK